MNQRWAISSFFQMFFPHHCLGCGSDVISAKNYICINCYNDLPYTHFAAHPDNPIEKKFWGRMPVAAAMSLFYFDQDSIIQNLIHQFKYNGNRELGRYLGNLLGKSLMSSNRFHADMIIPIPLFEKKERLRGFNQAAILANGISEIMHIPVTTDLVVRQEATDTQTKKSIGERWKNVEKAFHVSLPQMIENKHVLLIDDVITTGATIEACANAIMQTANVRLSIASLAVAWH
jgi:ComF family protein